MGVLAILRQIGSDLSMLPEKTAAATGTMDKTLKVTNSIFENAIYFKVIDGSVSAGAAILKGRFKDFTDLLSLPNVFTQVKNMLNGRFWVADRVKNIGTALLTLGQAFDFVRLLDVFKLVSLNTITSTIGRIPVLGTVAPLFLPIGVIKDSLFLGSTLTSLWQTSQNIAAENGNKARIQQKVGGWNTLEQDLANLNDGARLQAKINLCAQKIALNTAKAKIPGSMRPGRNAAFYTARVQVWTAAQGLLNNGSEAPFDLIIRAKNTKWNNRAENNQKLLTKGWISLAADISKVAVITLGLSMGVFGINPGTVVAAGFKFGSIFHPVAFVANVMGLYKPLHDSNPANDTV